MDGRLIQAMPVLVGTINVEGAVYRKICELLGPLGSVKECVLDEPLRLYVTESSCGSLQSFGGVSVFIAGRITNRNELKRQSARYHNLVSLDDAAVCSALYASEGLAGLHQLEGSTIIVVDLKTKCVSAVRDWVGLFPIFFWQNGGQFCFSTEYKVLRSVFGVSLRRVCKLRPASHFQYDFENAKLRVEKFYAFPRRRFTDPIPTAARKVKNLVQTAVQSALRPEKCVVMLSGGVDSTILAYCLKKCKPQVLGCIVSLPAPVIPTELENFDLYVARRVARWLDLPLIEVSLSQAELTRHLDEAIYVAETFRTTVVDELVGMLILARSLAGRGIEVAYCGEGCDDMFGCFPLFLRFYRGRRLAEFLRKVLQDELANDLAYLNRIFLTCGVQIIFPYMYKPLAEYAVNLPLRLRVDRAGLMKPLLRDAFRREIPLDFLNRPKAVTRDANHSRYVMERNFGLSRNRYFPVFNRVMSKGLG